MPPKENNPYLLTCTHKHTHTDSQASSPPLLTISVLANILLRIIVDCLFVDCVPFGILAPPPGRPGIKSIPQQWEYGVLTTGLPGNFLFKTKVLREKLHDMGFGSDFSDVTL